MGTFLAALLVFFPVAAPAWVDPTFHFEVRPPAHWVRLHSAYVPGSFRSGWLAPQTMRDRTHGATLVAFIQVARRDYTIQEAMEANAADQEAAGYRVVVKRELHLGADQGFLIESVARGTGFSLLPRGARLPRGRHTVFTRQRWLAIMRGRTVYSLMGTCAQATLATYAPIFHRSEVTFRVK